MKTETEIFQILSEGNPNSLGRLLEVLQSIKDREFSIQALITLYQKEDRYVSMRISNLLKRLWREDPKHILPYIDQLIAYATTLKNPTFRWTLAQIYDELNEHLSINQKQTLIKETKRNLQWGEDWIMLVQSMKALKKATTSGVDIQDCQTALLNLQKSPSKVVRAQANQLIKLIRS
jgi:hypothetical protein